MSSCCDTPLEYASPTGTLTVALAGNPNSGKTTLFNALTGLRQKVANYPGVTVEKKTGRCKLPGGTGGPERWVHVIDLPGTYSLISRSPDEQVAMEVLRGLRTDTPPPDVVIVVVDASNLQRNLYLVSQLIELGRPMVVALNMMDVAERRGLTVSPEALQKELGVPVVPLVGHKKKGVEELKAAVVRAAVARLPDWPLPDPMREELLLVGGGLAILDGQEEDGQTNDRWNGAAGPQLDRYKALAERLLIGDRAADLYDLARRQPVASLLNAAMTRLESLGIDPMQADIEAHYRWIEGVAHRASSPAGDIALSAVGEPAHVLPYESQSGPDRTLTQKIDAVLIHKVWGLAIFAVIMAALFVSIFWLAGPLMDAVSGGVDALGAWVASGMADGPLKSLVVDGIFKGVGAVVVFVPQIAMLFLFLAILEDSGYLARAAFLMDRLLAKVGLHGKSFIPLLSSFACAIPGIMATRTIENRKDRLATIFIAPFMSCSARLPVYGLLIGTFFASYSALAQGGIMFACYALGIVAAVATAWVFKKSFLKGPAQAFILELPTYKVPQLSQVARQVWFNTSKFLTKAGTTIFCLSVILWAMLYYGASPAKLNQLAASGADENAVKATRLNESIAGRLGHAMEPVIKPLGYDWKMGVGLVASFAAREVFVATMGITYSVGETEDDTTSLADAMRGERYASGRPVWTPLVAVSLLVWFVLAMQCMSTLAIVRRETGGWKWPLFMLLYMNALAYVCSLTVFQVGSLLIRQVS